MCTECVKNMEFYDITILFKKSRFDVWSEQKSLLAYK